MADYSEQAVVSKDRPFTAVDKRALRAIAIQFFVNGALFASFIPRLPEIRDHVGISTAGIGLLTSIAGVTGLIASATVGRAIARFGTRRVMLVAGTLVSLSLPIVGLATTPIVLLIGLAGMLSFDVLVDVAMNMQGSWLSARRHAPVMNRLHGLWSLGTVIGGVSSSRIAASGVSLSTHLVLAGGILLALIGYVGRGVLRTDEHHQGGTETASKNNHERGRRFNPILVLFSLAGFFAVALASSSIEWAAFRLSDDFATSAGFAALAYVAVTTGMTVGRFAGDWATIKLGTQRLTQIGLAMSGLGLATASLTTNRYLVLAGYAMTGLGISTLMPMLYDTAAKHPGRTGAGLGALTAGFRTASLAIPLIVGTLAATSLSVGSSIAIVTLPALLGFLIFTTALNRIQSPRQPT
jgi:MFS family permease